MNTGELSAYPGEGFERRLIERFTSLRHKRVLEVGCGDGRLTFQQRARDASNIDFRVSSIEHLRAAGAPFDVALFSWSL